MVRLLRFIFRVLRTFIPLRNNPYPLLMFCVITTAQASTFLSFDASRRIPFEGNTNITLNLWHWQIQPDTNVILVYSNGVLANQFNNELNGNANIGLDVNALPSANMFTIGVIDDFISKGDLSHGMLVADVAYSIGGNLILALQVADNYNDLQVATQITNAVTSANCRVINMSFGYNQSTAPTNVLRAIAHFTNVLFVVSAFNSNGPQDNARDWIPNTQFKHVLCVNSFDKAGNHWYSGYGTNVFIGAPGRRVIANGYSTSGTSLAAPHVAGIAARLMTKYPNESALDIRERLKQGASKYAHWAGKNECSGMLNASQADSYHPAPKLNIIRDVGLVYTGPIGNVTIYSTTNLAGGYSVEYQFSCDGFNSVLLPLTFNENQKFYKL